MSYKFVVSILAQVAFTKLALSQCINGASLPNLTASTLAYGPSAYNDIAAPYGLRTGTAGMLPNVAAAPYAIDITPTSGGALPVTSASPIPPNSITVMSENVYEGVLTAAGELPFVGTVGVDGILPSAGAGAVNHACGNGGTMMASDIGYAGLDAAYPTAAFAPVGVASPTATIAPAPLGIRAGLTYPEYTGAYSNAYPRYGGVGEGNVAVMGELPVAGNTAVAGQVPIMGAVSFGGAAPATGAVSIAGQCACDGSAVYAY